VDSVHLIHEGLLIYHQNQSSTGPMTRIISIKFNIVLNLVSVDMGHDKMLVGTRELTSGVYKVPLLIPDASKGKFCCHKKSIQLVQQEQNQFKVSTRREWYEENGRNQRTANEK
jgi:hypothetical protein